MKSKAWYMVLRLHFLFQKNLQFKPELIYNQLGQNNLNGKLCENVSKTGIRLHFFLCLQV